MATIRMLEEEVVPGLNRFGPWVDCGGSSSSNTTLHLITNNPTSTLQATISLFGSNEYLGATRQPAELGSFVFSWLTELTPAYAGITAANGVITFNNPASIAAQHTYFALANVPRFLRARVQYTSGGFNSDTRWKMFFNANGV